MAGKKRTTTTVKSRLPSSLDSPSPAPSPICMIVICGYARMNIANELAYTPKRVRQQPTPRRQPSVGGSGWNLRYSLSDAYLKD